ncbi:MAG: helix-turn-helix domain-containing protein [Clostridia bacterium]|nr:helix-turn-helix domain-containing protein [Clostridia bacterium]
MANLNGGNAALEKTAPELILDVPELNVYMEYSSILDGLRDEDETFPPHLHDMLELYLHISGEAEFVVEGNMYVLSPGDVVVSKPDEIHYCITDDRKNHKHVCLWLDAANDFLLSDLMNSDTRGGSVVRPPEKEKERMIKLALDIKNADVAAKDLHRFACLTEILDIVNNNLYSKGTSGKFPATLISVLAEINDENSPAPSVESLAKKNFTSQSTLCRMFRKYMHTTPNGYIRTKKLAAAKKLLRSGASVKEAFQASGFKDYTNFLRAFKSQFSETPSQFKKT